MSKSQVEQHLDELDFDQRLSADFGTELQLEIDGVSMRLPTTLVGMDAGRFLIVRTPTASQLGGVGIKLFSGNRAVVRYIYRGSVYGFETTIIDAVSSPFRLVFLAYPKVVTERNIRSNRRVNTSLPARLGEGEEAPGGLITDISIAGCQLEIRNDKLGEAQDALKPSSEVAMTMQLPGDSGEYRVHGTIRNRQRREQTTEFGIAFGELEEDVQLAIDGYVKLAE